jgi:hypothetical protein
MMRGLVVNNVLSRREGTVLFLPIDPGSDPLGDRAIRQLARLHRLAGVRGVV